MVKNSIQQRVQSEAYLLVLLQIACVALLSIIGLLVNGILSGYSMLAGGMAYCLPSLAFVWLVFRFTGAQQMVAFLSAFFVGEMLKLIISAILFLLIVKYLPHSLLSVLVGYIGAIVSFWFVCLWHVTKEAKAKQQVLW
jgi:ATP synthase protein I